MHRPIPLGRLDSLAVGALAAVALAGCSVLGVASGAPATATPRATAAPAAALAADTPFVPASIAFWDAANGIAVGTAAAGGEIGTGRATGAVAVTADAGKSWRLARLGSGPLASVTVAGAASAWATGTCPAAGACAADLYRTDDRGRSWTRLPGVGLVDMAFGDDRSGWALPVGARTPGLPTFLARTSDGGASWGSGPAPCTAVHLEPQAVSFVAATRGLVVCVGDPTKDGQAKAVTATTDGGATWATVAAVGIAAAVDASPAPKAGAGQGSGGLPLHGLVRDVAAVPGGPVWLVTSTPAVLASDDGGRTWTPIPVPAPPLSAWPLDHGAGFILVHDAKAGTLVLLGTADGGKTWPAATTWPAAIPAPS